MTREPPNQPPDLEMLYDGPWPRFFDPTGAAGTRWEKTRERLLGGISCQPPLVGNHLAASGFFQKISEVSGNCLLARLL